MREKTKPALETSPLNVQNQDILLKDKARHVPFVPSIPEHRERVAKIQSSLSPADVPYVDIVVPLSEQNIKMPVRIYLPKKKINAPLPTLFYFPGTGFVANERSCTHVICSHLCEKTQCQVIEVRNRLAPENPFPIGIEDAYGVFTYFIKEWHHYYHIDLDKVAIAGYSSGGNFAALIAIQAIKDNIFIRRQILISPMVDLSRSLNLFKDAEEKDVAISENFLRWIIELYVPESVNLRDPAVSPFWQPNKTFQRLPPTDIFIGEWDRTRSDAEFYHQKLKFNGVVTEKFLAQKQDHSYLWHNLNVVEKVSERLQNAFKMEPTNDLFNQHRLYFIKAAPETSKEEATENKQHSSTAKL